jgi:Domain of unknown function (DUF1707)
VTSIPNDVPPPRISEYDRDMAVKRLQQAFIDGLLSREELDDRLQVVLTAKAHGELGPALATLPEMSAGRVLRLAAKSGPIRRRGVWRVPRVLKVESEYGRVNLDLSRAIIEDPVVDIELLLRFGRAKITLPDDAVVDLDDLRTVWKPPVYETPRTDLGGPKIRISGTMEYGRLKIRHKRR